MLHAVARRLLYSLTRATATADAFFSIKRDAEHFFDAIIQLYPHNHTIRSAFHPVKRQIK